MTAMTQTRTAYVSTPVLTLGGSPDAEAMSNLLAVTVEETTAGLAWCEITLNNWGIRGSAPGYLYPGGPLDLGTALAVRFGPGDAGRQVFSGMVSALEADYPPDAMARMTVLAEDGLQALRLTRRTRSFEDSTTAQIADQVAGDHGLTADVDLPGPSRRVSAQVNQSDLAFLRGLARADDGEVWLEGSTVRIRRRPGRDEGTVSLEYGADLLSFGVRADLADQVSDVAVTGWSVADKDAVAESADPQALAAELGSGQRSGSDLLGDVFGPRHERIVRSGPLAADDAQALARAAYLDRARRFVRGTGTTAGTAALRVGARVRLAGLGPAFEGEYYVSRTRHEYDVDRGYRTEFDVERAGLGTQR
jgi:phage protein D